MPSDASGARREADRALRQGRPGFAWPRPRTAAGPSGPPSDPVRADGPPGSPYGLSR